MKISLMRFRKLIPLLNIKNTFPIQYKQMNHSDPNSQRQNSNSVKKKLIRVNVNSRWLPEDFFPKNTQQSPSKNSDHYKLNEPKGSISPESPQKRFLNRIRRQKQYLFKQQDLVKTSEGSIEQIVDREIEKNSNRYCRLQKQESGKVELYLQMIKANLRSSFKENDEFAAIIQKKPQYNKNIRQNHHINAEISQNNSTQNSQQKIRCKLKSERQSREQVNNRSSSLIKVRRSLYTANSADPNNPRKNSSKALPTPDTLKLKYRYSDQEGYTKIKKQDEQNQRRSNPECGFDPSGIFTFYGNVNITLDSKSTFPKGVNDKNSLKNKLPKIK